MDKIRTKSFTEKFKYTARSIKTYCQISEAFVADVSNDRKPKFEKANALWDTVHSKYKFWVKWVNI